jgi:serine/threonine-protein kinase
MAMKKLIVGGFAAAVTALGITTAGAAHAQVDPRWCGGNVYAGNDHTSCPFARNVAVAWYRSPSNQVGATSPATGEFYIMDCAYVDGVEVCRGGDDAIVGILL